MGQMPGARWPRASMQSTLPKIVDCRFTITKADGFVGGVDFLKAFNSYFV